MRNSLWKSQDSAPTAPFTKLVSWSLQVQTRSQLVKGAFHFLRFRFSFKRFSTEVHQAMLWDCFFFVTDPNEQHE